MKKVKYVGDTEVALTTLGLVVKNGDVVDVPDDFANELFQEVPPAKTTKGDDK